MTPIFEQTASPKSSNNVFDTYEPTVSSPIIVAWPHNGLYVPEELHINAAPLGWPASAFDPENLKERRHEAADWGMTELLADILPLMPNTHIVSKLSRLVVDHNRVAEFAITENSDDTGQAVPANLELTMDEINDRIKRLHTPYHDEIDRAIQAAKAAHGFAAVLDMHSFTRNFMGRRRDVCLGTIKPYDTYFSRLVEHELEARGSSLGLDFKADAPYDIRLDTGICDEFKIRNAGQDIARRNGVDYVGIEICNDALLDPEQRHNIARLVSGITADITPKLEHEASIALDNQQS